MTPYYERDGIVIYHGDCREMLERMEPSSVRLLWTDPPYGCGNQDGDLQSARVLDLVRGGRVKPAIPIVADKGNAWESTMREFFDIAPRVMMSDCCCCCCCCGGGGPTPVFARVSQWLDSPPWTFFHAVVWDKSARGNGLGWRFRRNYEFVMVAHVKGGKLAWSDSSRSVPNIVRMMPEPNTHHPTMKPQALVGSFIEWTTTPGELVLDPFMGSGTTLVAAKQLGRTAIGIEIEERYCEVAAKRLDATTRQMFPDPPQKAEQGTLL